MHRYFKRKTPSSASTSTSTNSIKNESTNELDLTTLPIDPGLRLPITSYHPCDQDVIRRYYLKLGPCQPKGYDFPFTKHGNHNRRFNPAWFFHHSEWLEYSLSKDAIFCMFCYLCGTSHLGHNAFSSGGFSNWKKPEKIFKHVGAVNSAHNIAKAKCLNLLSQDPHITTAVDRHSDQVRASNHTHLNATMEVVRFSLDQELSFCGRGESDDSTNPDMSNDHIDFDQENEENPVSKGRSRAVVWEYFEKITGDDGLPKTRCTKCNKVYNTAPSSGTSTMRRHLRKCFPQPLTQVSPTQACPMTKTARSNDEPPNEVRVAKKSKSVMEENLRTKTDRELKQFIWNTKRNIPLLEERLPNKAIIVKETLKCFQDELDRRAKLLHHKENSPDRGASIESVKVELDDQPVARNENFGENTAEDGRAMEGETTSTHADVSQPKTSPQLDTGEVVIKVEMGDESVAGNNNFDVNVAEEENAGRLQIVERHGDENQPSAQQSIISIRPEDMCAELRKVSSVLSMLTSPHSFYTPEGNPLDKEAEQAKQALIELLKKDFATIVGTPDEQNVKSCIQILIKNLDKLPRVQGRVVESLHAEFEAACQNWRTCRMNVDANVVFEVQQRDNLEVLQEWQEKDMELESSIAKVDADILRLKAELLEKELTRESLVKRKSIQFDQSKISIDEAKNLLQEMVSMKLQSDVAIDNMKDLATKWEKIRESFLFK